MYSLREDKAIAGKLNEFFALLFIKEDVREILIPDPFFLEDNLIGSTEVTINEVSEDLQHEIYQLN